MKLFNFRKDQKGITIAEIAISVPVAAIIVVTLISILFSQYTIVLAETRKANLRTEAQALLTTLQDELLFTIE